MYAVDTVFLCPIDNHVTGNDTTSVFIVYHVMEMSASEAHSRCRPAEEGSPYVV